MEFLQIIRICYISKSIACYRFFKNDAVTLRTRRTTELEQRRNDVIVKNLRLAFAQNRGFMLC